MGEHQVLRVDVDENTSIFCSVPVHVIPRLQISLYLFIYLNW